MPRQQQISLALCFGGSYTLTYLLCQLLPLPLLWYLPLERRWVFGWPPTEGLIMGWYGMLAWSLGLGLCCTALLFAWQRLRPRQNAEPEARSHMSDLCLMAVVVFTLFFIARSLMVHELQNIELERFYQQDQLDGHQH
ncbi:MAG: hypothetical protein IGS03_18705 [Candidatus Sericytochromatia bacterium]|nr:hypothetical protein [Candidatus Sericytochromatia bacterium]